MTSCSSSSPNDVGCGVYSFYLRHGMNMPTDGSMYFMFPKMGHQKSIHAINKVNKVLGWKDTLSIE